MALADEEGIPLRLLEGVAAYLSLPSETDARVEVALRALEAAAARRGVTWQEYRTTHYEDADLALADLVVVIGVGVERNNLRFLVNEDNALDTADGCPVCGSGRPENRQVRGVPRVVRELLDRPASTVDVDGNPCPLRGPHSRWDAVNLVNRALVVSTRLVTAIPTNRGLTSSPVAGPSGRALDDLRLLSATSTARICTQHSYLPPDGVCPRCGTVLADQTEPGLLSIRESDLTDLDGVSTGMHLHGPLALRPTLLDQWETHGIEGISRIRPMHLCRH
ncbi:hypothetical protein ACWCOV_34395 [Kribbella sp. NPDC002412]